MAANGFLNINWSSLPGVRLFTDEGPTLQTDSVIHNPNKPGVSLDTWLLDGFGFTGAAASRAESQRAYGLANPSVINSVVDGAVGSLRLARFVPLALIAVACVWLWSVSRG
jgi:hypothetical protein